jgi:hypothetical protein
MTPKEKAELINKEEVYPELDGTIKLCEDIVSKRKINLEEMPKEEWDEARNLAYKHFNIDDKDDICEYSGLRSVTSYAETNEPLYTEEELSEIDKQILINTITNPPTPNEELKKGAIEHKKIVEERNQ